MISRLPLSRSARAVVALHEAVSWYSFASSSSPDQAVRRHPDAQPPTPRAPVQRRRRTLPTRLTPSPCLTQQLHRRAAFLLELRDRALPRRLVRAPAQERRPVAEPSAGEVVVLHLDHQLRREGLPFARSLGAPSRRSTRRLAGETRGLHQLLELRGERLLLPGGNVRGEADMVQQSALVVETEQQRADDLPLRRVAKAADHALGGALVLHLLHPVAVAALVRQVEPLRDDAVESTADGAEPLLHRSHRRRRR